MKTKPKTSRTRKAPRRIGAKKGGKLSIREITEQADGYSWTTYMVQGFREDGKWKRRKFKSRADAESFVALKSVELLNQDTKLREVITALSSDQLKEAESGFARLAEMERAGDGARDHTLGAAIEYYLKNHKGGKVMHKEFDFAIREFLKAKERDGIRPRTITQLNATLRQFERTVDSKHVCETTQAHVQDYLDGLRSKDGKSKAAPKTFNNYRMDLHGFFQWCAKQTGTDEQGSKAQWILEDPTAKIKVGHVPRRGKTDSLSATQVRAIMEHVESYRGTKTGPAGIMVPYFALALFSGLRTDPHGELHKLAEHPDKLKLIDLETGIIHVQPEISKTGAYRKIKIRPALMAWLKTYGLDILPSNAVRHVKKIRRAFNIGRDELRHTYFSMHIAAFKSVGEAALEGGNTERIVMTHYLNLSTSEQGEEFWSIKPKGAEKKIISIGNTRKRNITNYNLNTTKKKAI